MFLLRIFQFPHFRCNHKVVFHTLLAPCISLSKAIFMDRKIGDNRDNAKDVFTKHAGRKGIFKYNLGFAINHTLRLKESIELKSLKWWL